MASVISDRFFLTKNDIIALCAFTSTDAGRPDLNGVVFDAHEGRIFATDGRTLVSVTPRHRDFLPSSAPFRFGVPRDVLKCRAKQLPKGHGLVVYVTEAAVVVATSRETSLGSPVVSTEIPYDPALVFPYHEAAIPSGSYEATGTSTAINAEYLARLALVQSACGAPAVDMFASETPLAGVKFEASHDDATWVAVIMPVRSERAVSLHEASRAERRTPALSMSVRRKLAEPLFRRVVERLTSLSVDQMTWFEELLAGFVPEPESFNSLDGSVSRFEGPR